MRAREKKKITNVGIVGCGFAAGLHIPRLKELGASVCAYYDIDRTKAENLKYLYGGKVYSDLPSFFECSELDAVYICTPPNAHLEPVEMACKYRIPIFLEKPIAHCLEEGKKIVDKIESTGTLAQVGFNWRFAGGVQELKGMIEAKDVEYFNGHWHGWALNRSEWWSKKEVTGGLVNEIASHLYDLARYLCGEVKSVKFATEKRIVETPAATNEDTLVSIFEFENGGLGAISFTLAARVSKSLGFTDSVQFWNHQDIGALIVTKDRAYQLIGNSIVIVNVGSLRSEKQLFLDSLVMESKAFLESLKTGVSKLTAREGYKTLEFVIAAKSLSTNS